MRAAILLDLAQRHGLDQRQVEALDGAPAQHRLDLAFVEAPERDHVDLDLETRCLGRRDPRQHLVEPPAPRDVRELVWIEAVQADVDPPHSAREQARCRSPPIGCRWWSASARRGRARAGGRAARRDRGCRAAQAARHPSAAAWSRPARSADRPASRSRRSSATRLAAGMPSARPCNNGSGSRSGR